jgi:hypothetical protein
VSFRTSSSFVSFTCSWPSLNLSYHSKKLNFS